MADIKNKNELKRRIDLFMDELDYSINEEFCKETMLMMREFIGRASHLLDCADAKIKKAKRTEREKAIDEMISKLLPYGSLCAEWNGGMTKEEIAESVLNQAKEQFIDILEQMKGNEQ